MPAEKQFCDIKITDIDVGGDLHRVILGGVPVPPGKSAFDVRELFLREHDELRRVMLATPYGDQDMCTNLVFESTREDAAYGNIIMECMGYPYFSGSNTSATIAALLEYGLVPRKEGVDILRHEVPSGVVEATYRVENDVVKEIMVEGDDSYVMADGQNVEVPGYGRIDYALVWCGAVFIMVDAERFSIRIDEDHLARMKTVGPAVVNAVGPEFHQEHPTLGPLEAPKFVNFMGPSRNTGDRRHEGCGAVYGYPNTVFRCPTGTGTASRMALAITRNEMEPDALFRNTSAIGTQFTGRALGWRRKGGTDMLGISISSTPYILSTATLHMNFDNSSLKPFAKLRDLLNP